MKMLLKWTGGILAGIAAAVLLLWWAVLPPRLNAVAQQDLILSGVTVVNPGTKRLTGQTIVIRQGRIEAIRPIAANDPEPICEGCFAMPGLIDAHVHTPPSFIAGNQRLFALMYLRYGVTSVRDVGQSEAGIADFAAALNAGAIAGPHM
ncbi:amidohydrolase family protein, partial [Parvibaculum sp.]